MYNNETKLPKQQGNILEHPNNSLKQPPQLPPPTHSYGNMPHQQNTYGHNSQQNLAQHFTQANNAHAHFSNAVSNTSSSNVNYTENPSMVASSYQGAAHFAPQNGFAPSASSSHTLYTSTSTSTPITTAANSMRTSTASSRASSLTRNNAAREQHLHQHAVQQQQQQQHLQQQQQQQQQAGPQQNDAPKVEVLFPAKKFLIRNLIKAVNYHCYTVRNWH